MGRIEWDVEDCMDSRQDYMLASGKKREIRIARGTAQVWRRCTGFHRVMGRGILVWQYNDNVCGIPRSYEERRFSSAHGGGCDDDDSHACGMTRTVFVFLSILRSQAASCTSADYAVLSPNGLVNISKHRNPIDGISLADHENVWGISLSGMSH